MFSEFATLDPKEIDYHLRDVRPATDAAEDGDKIAFSDDQARFVVDGSRQVGDERMALP